MATLDTAEVPKIPYRNLALPELGVWQKQQFFSDNPLAMGALSADGRLLAVNRSLAYLLGRSEEKLVESTLREVLPLVAKRAERLTARILRTGQARRPAPFDGYLPTARGPRGGCWQAYLFPLRDGQGQLRAVGFTLAEYGPLRRRDREARERCHLFSLLLDQFPDAIFLKDSENTYRYINGKGAALLGRTPGEVVGKTDFDLFPAKSAQKIWQRDRFLMRGKNPGVTYEDEEWMGGRRVVFQSTKLPLRSAQGEVLGLLGVSREITEQKRREEERGHLIEALESAKHSLEAEKENREQIVASLGHDLRSPLTVAHMAAQVLGLKDTAPALARSFLGRLQASLTRMDHMIRDLLDVSRIDAGHGYQPKRSQVVFPEIIRKGLEDLQLLYPNRIRTALPSGRYEAQWDESAVQRVLENLVHNAVRHGATGAPITVRAGVIGNGKTAFLSVHNEGPAISPALQCQIFDRFRRGSPAEQLGPGWGLGLSIVKTLVEAHGGSLALESVEPKGTTFLVKLPI